MINLNTISMSDNGKRTQSLRQTDMLFHLVVIIQKKMNMSVIIIFKNISADQTKN